MAIVNRQKKHKFDVLHEYWHLAPWDWKEQHTENEYLCDIIDDTVLRTVMEKTLSERGERNGISYLFGIRKGSELPHGDID